MKTLSKTISFPITNNHLIDIKITKKRMKNIRLTISKLGNINVSIPYNTTYSYAYQFLTRKRTWINTQLKKINANLLRTSCNFTNNGNIFLLGNNYPLSVMQGTRNKVIFNNTPSEQPLQTNSFTIYIKSNDVDIKSLFVKWCKKYFLDFFTNRLNFIYNQIFKNSLPPNTKIKTMKSMWGNCNYVKKVITLNLYLAKTPIECIDYVIIHELCHLIHHNHSKDFYNLMNTLLPDWKVRKKALNKYTLTF
ncbi:MAG: M48 family metallopeptidase [Clostridia bacterium]